MTKVSVLMNCCNCDKYLTEAIDSVYGQSFQDFEIVFIDNSSKDKSREIIKRYDNRLKYYSTPNFMTLGDARTFGLRFCNSEFLAFLDTDDVWYPEHLEKSLAVLESDLSNSVMTYANIEFIDHNSRQGKLLFKKKMPSGNLFRDLIKGYFITIVTVVVKRSCVKEVGDRFNSEYELIADLELFTDISYQYEISYVDQVLAKVRKHTGSLTSKKFIRFPVETEMYINCLRKRIDSFDLKYKDELKYLNVTLQYQYALSYWMDGDNMKAKEKLKDILRYRMKYILVYFFMNFSYVLFERTMRFLRVGNY